MVFPFDKPSCGENSVSHDQIIENFFDEKIRKEFGNAVTTVKNRIHDPILAAMDSLVILRVGMAVRSTNGSP